MNEEQIRAAWVVEPTKLAGTVHLAEYDPEWPSQFTREDRRIRAALGDRVVRLEHTGSTSVPGLAAKPIIDMLLVLENTADESGYVPQLEAAGYRLVIREPDWHEHRVFKGPDTNVNLHVFPRGSPEIERVVAFRDWLRTHDDDRERYERTKRELAAREWAYIQNYADAKSEVVESIIVRAGVGAFIGRMRDAWNAGDIERLVAGYADDAVIHRSGAAPAVGGEAVRAASEAGRRAGTRLDELDPAAIEIVGEIAWVRARYAAGGTSGWLLAVLRRVDAEWLTAAESWTSD